ncbi:MAG: inorganic phosphate transporter [Bacteroidales bacterium]|nr:inorganic phosphate transporter [Bacteroidales bacterium]MDT8432177.1 inorganic phosphate transporter [Bacteroidales bacterium]
MESYYLLIVIVLFILAISDLVVGVSNDAVNFLNSAIGSKAAPFMVILSIAAAGVLVGAVFSNGMMEVARKGIFHPDMFSFSEIMVVFLAVMMTDILLLDFFNTVGLPTSTTVSIVFELLGSSVAVALFKILGSNGEFTNMSTFINTDSAMLIIAGIFLSVLVAFTVGLIIMAIVRFAFSFNILKTYKYWGGIWGGFAITAILYFLLIKGAKGSTLVDEEMVKRLNEHSVSILLISFAGWTAILQLLVLFTRINIMKLTVLIGTFALAMAFAGNDLVNFIGVPLAGFESFKAFIASGVDPDAFMMTALTEKVNTPLIFLVAAGLIMVITLRLSKKAKSVVATSIDLSRQGEGSERFASSGLARFLVRRTIEISNAIGKFTPAGVKKFANSRFDTSKSAEEYKKKKVAFDLVRASVNLVVASILIAIGTSLKLPLSTTYVTFMVAMGSSLADGAWGRESAVYRISGVLTVIGGWFFTALTAFIVSFLIATIIFFGKLPVILALIALSIFILIRTHALHKKRVEDSEKRENGRLTETPQIIAHCEDEVKTAIIKISKLLFLTFAGFEKENHKELKSIKKQAKKLNKSIKSLKNDVPETLRVMKENELESGHYYVQVIDHLKEVGNSLYHVILPAYNHLDNNHALDREQFKDLKQFNEEINEFFNFTITMMQNRKTSDMDEIIAKRDKLIESINGIIKQRIKILKKKQKGTKVSMTYIEMLTETKNLILHVVQLIKADASMIDSMK